MQNPWIVEKAENYQDRGVVVTFRNKETGCLRDVIYSVKGLLSLAPLGECGTEAVVAP